MNKWLKNRFVVYSFFFIIHLIIAALLSDMTQETYENIFGATYTHGAFYSFTFSNFFNALIAGIIILIIAIIYEVLTKSRYFDADLKKEKIISIMLPILVIIFFIVNIIIPIIKYAGFSSWLANLPNHANYVDIILLLVLTIASVASYFVLRKKKNPHMGVALAGSIISLFIVIIAQLLYTM